MRKSHKNIIPDMKKCVVNLVVKLKISTKFWNANKFMVLSHYPKRATLSLFGHKKYDLSFSK